MTEVEVAQAVTLGTCAPSCVRTISIQQSTLDFFTGQMLFLMPN